MITISSWILSICGIVVVGLLAEIVLPSGKTNKLIKSVLALLSISTIIYPLKQIDFENFDINNLFDSQIKIDSEFVENRNNEKIKEIEIKIENDLLDNGYTCVDIEILGCYKKEKLLIENVYVDLSDLVLTDKKLNINKYTNIVAIIKNIIDVKEECIVFYE